MRWQHTDTYHTGGYTNTLRTHTLRPYTDLSFISYTAGVNVLIGGLYSPASCCCCCRTNSSMTRQSGHNKQQPVAYPLFVVRGQLLNQYLASRLSAEGRCFIWEIAQHREPTSVSAGPLLCEDHTTLTLYVLRIMPGSTYRYVLLQQLD